MGWNPACCSIIANQSHVYYLENLFYSALEGTYKSFEIRKMSSLEKYRSHLVALHTLYSTHKKEYKLKWNLYVHQLPEKRAKVSLLGPLLNMAGWEKPK